MKKDSWHRIFEPIIFDTVEERFLEFSRLRWTDINDKLDVDDERAYVSNLLYSVLGKREFSCLRWTDIVDNKDVEDERASAIDVCSSCGVVLHARRAWLLIFVRGRETRWLFCYRSRAL